MCRLNKSDIKCLARLGTHAITKLNNGEAASTDVILKICRELNCDMSEVIEINLHEVCRDVLLVSCMRGVHHAKFRPLRTGHQHANQQRTFRDSGSLQDSEKMVEVVAALIWDKDKFMICQRPENKARGLLWEFVGGKVEPGETREQALIRECREELAIALAVGDKFMDVVHEYPDITVHLTLFNAAIVQGTPQKLEHNDIRWITVEEISQYEFCQADMVILRKLGGLRYDRA
jgi:mutator protein MutT